MLVMLVMYVGNAGNAGNVGNAGNAGNVDNPGKVLEKEESCNIGHLTTLVILLFKKHYSFIIHGFGLFPISSMHTNRHAISPTSEIPLIFHFLTVTSSALKTLTQNV